jgi:Beta-lactamase enzyme family
VARFAVAFALVLVAAAVVLAAAAPLDDEPEQSARAEGLPASIPALRDPSDVSPAGDRSAPPLALYPALSPQRGLAPPSARALADARRFAASREGEVSFAVLGPNGQITGRDTDRQFESASLVKAMILVAFLRKVATEGREPSELELQRMDDMIRVSDNFSASELYEATGTEALEELAAEAGMRAFETNAFWGSCLVTAEDQVRFFLSLDRLLPAAYRDFARDLLENIVSFHSWGIPEAARPEWRVLFKGGWRPDEEDGQIVHQAALLERGSRKVAVAVLTRLNPSETYGHDTARGIARRLLSSGVAPGVLVPLPALEGFEAPEPRQLRPPA